MTVTERIMVLINNSGMKPMEISRLTGIDKSSFTRWKQKDYKPSIDSVVALSQYFNVSLDWLLTGEGEMQKKLPTEQPPPIEVYAKIEPPQLPIDEEIILDYYRTMTKEGKKKAHNVLSKIKDENIKPQGDLPHSGQRAKNELA